VSRQHQLRHGAAFLVLATCAACASAPGRHGADTAPSLAGAQTLVSDRLFFGRDIPGGGQVSDSAWAAFLAEVVTPRLPAGLTVWRAEGQWRDPRGDAVHEPVMVVEVLHPRGVPPDSTFDRIAAEYRRRFRQDAVLRATAEVRTLLYAAPRR
jgi:hypothetical protein